MTAALPRSLMVAGATVVTTILYMTSTRLFPSNSESFTPTSSDPVLARLQGYLRIRTDHPKPDYTSVVTFLNRTLTTLLPDANVTAYEFIPGKPVLLACLPATHPDEPALLLNSHTDVVPAEPEKWTFDPFSATIASQDGEERIYARGSQDMKSVGMQYIEALASLKQKKRDGQTWKPRRPIILSFVPDEEIGGVDGMKALVDSPIFQTLNIGVALDEGVPHPEETFNVYYGERQTWWLHITVTGSPAHGATLPENTAAQTLHTIVGRALDFRLEQFAEVEDGGKDIGDVVNVNVVFLDAGTPASAIPGGFVMNMIPSSARVGFDIRVPPSISKEVMDAEVERWISCDDGKRCPGVSLRWVHKVDIPVMTSRDPTENPFIVPFASGLRKAGIVDRLFHGIFFAATDSRYLRSVGVPCFGFSPMEKIPNLLHKHDEYIAVDGYMAGIAIYEDIIKEIADFSTSGEGIVEWASDGVVQTTSDSLDEKENGAEGGEDGEGDGWGHDDLGNEEDNDAEVEENVPEEERNEEYEEKEEL